MTVSLIAAVAANRAIGKGGALPWRLPSDLRRFKRLTMGHAIVMGRRTFDSIGRPLPGRTNIVLTRDPAWRRDGVETARSLDDALAKAGEGEVFVIGGGEIYAAALPRASRLYLTLVPRAVEGDAFFPEYDPAGWKEVEREELTDPEPHSFVVLERKELR